MQTACRTHSFTRQVEEDILDIRWRRVGGSTCKRDIRRATGEGHVLGGVTVCGCAQHRSMHRAVRTDSHSRPPRDKVAVQIPRKPECEFKVGP